ncbi:hypothetical protein AL538_00375 [Vibrio harveyi]|uniref:EF-hand domain-containing protein n=2 Tax=Vibrio harveyi TaxID=669 RepID=A0ABM5XT15_VIBHA|nr:hypothetical protein AL538_00375 [Vibrio harveyi]
MAFNVLEVIKMININFLNSNGCDQSYKPRCKKIILTKGHIERLVTECESMANTLELKVEFAKTKGTTDVLMTALLHQKNIVVQMLSSNPEDAIALSLSASIEAYGTRLEIIEGWTNGGVEMFESTLWFMLKDIEADGVISPGEMEDLFQLALLEVMAHPEKYDLEGWYKKNKEDISHILESTGSGSHGLHESNYDSPKKLAHISESLYEGILKNAVIPQGSLLDCVIQDLASGGGIGMLSDQIEYNYYSDYGWWANGTAGTLSPTLRLFLLSTLLAHNPQMSQQDVELVLTENIGGINTYVASIFGKDSSGQPYTALSFLCENTQWQIQVNDPMDGCNQIDWRGDGIEDDDLIDLYSNFPPRELTEEEIEEVNRIGDQVKMLQQTLLSAKHLKS